MLEETVTKDDAKRIISHKSKRILLYAFIGLVIASVVVYRKYPNPKLTFGIVIPFTALITSITLWLSLLVQRKLIEDKTYHLDEEMVSLSDRTGKTEFLRDDISNIKENKTGLIVESGYNEIRIPIYLKSYSEFKRILL